MSDNRQLETLWAKLPKPEEQSAAIHPLLCHMVDVAVVTREMWRTVVPARARQRVEAAWQLTPDAALAWVTYLAALHDLGKASPAFQLRKEARYLLPLYAELGAAPNVEAHECPHGRVTASELPPMLEASFGLKSQLANQLAVLIGGHHGTFPTSLEIEQQPSAGVGGKKWQALRCALVEALAELFNVPKDQAPQACDHATAMYVAGLVSVADWIGSNSEFFPYFVSDWQQPFGLDLATYRQHAAQQAQSALQRLGWLGWRQPAQALPFDKLFPFAPRPLQQAAIDLTERLTTPSLVIVEAPMGEGKTEAALYLAEQWGTESGARGCYLALPTQATSNQMFTRVRDFLGARYGAERAHLQLLHGHAALSAEFMRLQAAFEPSGIYGADECGAHGTSVVAAEWFTYRKRGLLAPFGVGTIDQALLAVLQTRHVFVRLFGLAHKVIIVDEVHAYDAYMSKLLERLLEWLAALGSPVVLLSATLPDARRRALLAAYRRGLHEPLTAADEQSLTAAYPRVTWADRAQCGAQSIAVSPLNQRTLHLEWIDGALPEAPGEPFALGAALQAALADDGCAAVICNTVRRAQEVYQALQPYFSADELGLFHARFLFKDRDEREQQALARFGKDVACDNGATRPVARPKRFVLVATQVVEQSLDLDFDLMVSDHAPVDLLLQRSGRLHRHKRPRPPRLAQPTLWLCQPEQIVEGVPQFERGTTAVYDAHILLRSWLALRARATVRIPEEIETLIESVYGAAEGPADESEAVQSAWQATAQELRDALRKQEALAQQAVVPEPHYPDDILDLPNKRLAEDEPEIHQSLQALTRLTEPNVSVICLYPAECIALDVTRTPTLDEAKRLLRYSVTLSDRRVMRALLAQDPPAHWQSSALLRRYRLLELDEAGGYAVGKYQIQLHADLGVVISELNAAAPPQSDG